ncbi:MAG: DUF1800 family protein [Pseudomonadota bacterium]
MHDTRTTWTSAALLATGLIAFTSLSHASTGRPPPGAFQSPWLPAVSGFLWNETAVRKVLHAFAYGGMATEAQIAAWADMDPQHAIRQMLTTDTRNLLLAPPAPGDTDDMANRDGTLGGLVAYWSSGDPSVPVLDPGYHQYPERSWLSAASLRGLNPVRQKLGLWETNYHMVTNQRKDVTPGQLYRYYDDVLDAIATGTPYQDVLTIGATSAAIALQYKHYENVWLDDVCYCNEDFAREYHQLFFGILGGADSQYHETVTIKNTAAVLTDMRLEWDDATGWPDVLEFGTEFHAPGPLEVLGASIAGSTALEKIDALSQFAIEHPESLDNLPILIIAGLADDALTTNKDAMQRIRGAWQEMQPKNLLEFLRTYAISYQFHSPNRVKYLTSVDRHMLIANQVTLTNRETYLEFYTPWDLSREGVYTFSPRHNVFGAQTSLEAVDSAEVFRVNYNRTTADYWRYARSFDDYWGWEKDWTLAAPRDTGGNFNVEQVAEWLWKRFIGDGLKNFGELERAHVYSLLAHGVDLVHTANRVELEDAGENPNNLDLYDFERVVTSADLQGDPLLAGEMTAMADATLALESTDLWTRRNANYRIGQAINFIVATPFVFIQEGR